jgi:hypothetical protein
VDALRGTDSFSISDVAWCFSPLRVGQRRLDIGAFLKHGTERLRHRRNQKKRVASAAVMAARTKT